VRAGRLARSAARFAVIAVLVLVAAGAMPPTKKPKTKPTPKPAPTAALSEELAPKAFFWEAQSENGARLFLLGSVHIGDGRELVLDPRIEKDWTEAQELVVELDTTTLSPVDAVDATNRFGLLPRGTTLRDVVKPDTYKQVAKYMKQREYPIERVDRMRPWLVAQVVTQLEYAAAGLEAENGVDVAMMRRATGRKGIVPLESLEEQAALFAGLLAPLQEKMLVEILREAQALLAVTRATLAAWEQGDEATLSGLLFSNASGDAALTEFYERVFYGRNRAMTDRLVTLAADGRPRFVVVGTGHLIGAQGIPELLAQRGFRVERVGSARVLPGARAMSPGAIPAPSATPVEATVPPPNAAPIAPPAPNGPTVPATASDTAPTIPVPVVPTVTPAPAQPAPPFAPSGAAGGPSDSWLGQDAGTAPLSGPAPSAPEALPSAPRVAPVPAVEPAPGPPSAVEPAPARPPAVEPAPAPPSAVEPTPAPPPATPKPKLKTRRLSAPGR